MAKDPAFLFYSSDFLTGTAFLSNDQVGMYIRALCHIHQQGHLTEKQLKHICGGYDDDVFSKFSIDENGLFFNERLESEIIKRRKHSEKQRENILKRWNKEDTEVIPPYKNGITSVIPLENENINDIILSSNEINKGVAKIENNLPAKRTRKVSKAWDESDPEGMINLPGDHKKKLPENQFLQILKWQGKKPQAGNELVWLSDIEFEELVIRAGDRNIALKAIENLHEHKQENQGVRTYSDDSRKVMGWALDKARQSAKIAGYDPNKERMKQKKLGENMNLFINQNPQE